MKNKVKIIAILCSLLIVIGLVPVNAATAGEVSIGVGDGVGEVLYTEERDEAMQFGPESFAVSVNGTFYILDTVANQIEVFDKKGAYDSTIDLSDGYEFIDIEIDNNGEISVLANSGEIFFVSNKGELAKSDIVIEDMAHLSFNYLQKQKDGSISHRDLIKGTEKDLKSGAKRESLNAATFKKVSKMEMEITYGEDSFILEYEKEPSATYSIGETAKDDLFVLKSEFTLGTRIETTAEVVKINKGKKTAVYDVYPMTEEFYLSSKPHKYIYATQNGRVYQMLCLADTVVIKELKEANAEKKASTNDNLALAVEADQTGRIFKTASPRSQSSYDKALDAFGNAWYEVDLDWFFDASEMRTPTSASTKPPGHLNKSTDSNETGIPYKWGGMNGSRVDDFSTYWNYEYCLSVGDYAGDINTVYVDSSTAGLDCSGFIAACYEVSYKLSTKTMSTKFEFPNPSTDSLVYGDIFNDYGVHVVMYYGYIEDYSGNIVGMDTFESTPAGYEDEAKYYSRSISEMNGYDWMVWK